MEFISPTVPNLCCACQTDKVLKSKSSLDVHINLVQGGDNQSTLSHPCTSLRSYQHIIVNSCLFPGRRLEQSLSGITEQKKEMYSLQPPFSFTNWVTLRRGKKKPKRESILAWFHFPNLCPFWVTFLQLLIFI